MLIHAPISLRHQAPRTPRFGCSSTRVPAGIPAAPPQGGRPIGAPLGVDGRLRCRPRGPLAQPSHDERRRVPLQCLAAPDLGREAVQARGECDGVDLATLARRGVPLPQAQRAALVCRGLGPCRLPGPPAHRPYPKSRRACRQTLFTRFLTRRSSRTRCVHGRCPICDGGPVHHLQAPA